MRSSFHLPWRDMFRPPPPLLLTSRAHGICSRPPRRVYVAPVLVGPNHNQYLLQVDTGSSDLVSTSLYCRTHQADGSQWLASTSCSTSACNGVGNGKYDSSQSLPTGQTATVNYAEGEATGPVVWDAVQFGGYSIDHQALSASISYHCCAPFCSPTPSCRVYRQRRTPVIQLRRSAGPRATTQLSHRPEDTPDHV